MKKEKQENNIGNLVAIIALTGLAIAAMWDKTPLEAPPINVSVQVASTTREVFVYYDNEKLPDCGIDDGMPCAYSCAPDGMCVFIPNGKEPLTRELIEKLMKNN